VTLLTSTLRLVQQEQPRYGLAAMGRCAMERSAFISISTLHVGLVAQVQHAVASIFDVYVFIVCVFTAGAPCFP
jgi:hypothetical protein